MTAPIYLIDDYGHLTVLMLFRSRDHAQAHPDRSIDVCNCETAAEWRGYQLSRNAIRKQLVQLIENASAALT